MSGHFEVFSSPEGGYSFRLKDAHGTVWATSGTFPTKRAVARAIALVREIAGTGLIRDDSDGDSGEPLQPTIRATPTAVHNGSDNPRRGPAHPRSRALARRRESAP